MACTVITWFITGVAVPVSMVISVEHVGVQLPVENVGTVPAGKLRRVNPTGPSIPDVSVAVATKFTTLPWSACPDVGITLRESAA